MYETILIPTDGSGGATRALEVAIELAARSDATLHALYVVDERFVATEYDMAVEKAEREGEAALDDAGRRGSEAGLDVEKHLRRGIPHEEILDAAGDYGADLVVVGTQGRTSLDRFLNLGSVADRVVRAASVQVLTVPLARAADDD